jgi:hypothetical protein
MQHADTAESRRLLRLLLIRFREMSAYPVAWPVLLKKGTATMNHTAHIKLIPVHDDTGGVRTMDGAIQRYFATVDELKVSLMRAGIDHLRYRYELSQLAAGVPVELFVTSLQWSAFYISPVSHEFHI